MYCPTCNGQSFVFDSRPTASTTRRRRCCESCGYKWTTYETTQDIGVIVKDVRKMLVTIDNILGKSGILDKIDRIQTSVKKIDEIIEHSRGGTPTHGENNVQESN